jgi:hypothetical protein
MLAYKEHAFFLTTKKELLCPHVIDIKWYGFCLILGTRGFFIRLRVLFILNYVAYKILSFLKKYKIFSKLSFVKFVSYIVNDLNFILVFRIIMKYTFISYTCGIAVVDTFSIYLFILSNNFVKCYLQQIFGRWRIHRLDRGAEWVRTGKGGRARGVVQCKTKGAHNEMGYFVCGHRVPWHRLTGAFVACNRRYLKSWVGNFSEGPFWTK